jgi:hypothetical protein
MLALRGVRHESEVLVRQVDGRLATLRARLVDQGGSWATDVDLVRAEEAATRLRTLVAQTTNASAADRARVRAAVHYFVGLRNTRERRTQRTLAQDLVIVNEIVRGLPER